MLRKWHLTNMWVRRVCAFHTETRLASNATLCTHMILGSLYSECKKNNEHSLLDSKKRVARDVDEQSRTIIFRDRAKTRLNTTGMKKVLIPSSYEPAAKNFRDYSEIATTKFIRSILKSEIVRDCPRLSDIVPKTGISLNIPSDSRDWREIISPKIH